MTLELAKQLKDAEFPQQQQGETQWYIGATRVRDEVGMQAEAIYFPTLSELIEACGDVTILLWGCTDHGYFASSQPCAQGFNQFEKVVAQAEGSTPEEAVARLWLALNKKT